MESPVVNVAHPATSNCVAHTPPPIWANPVWKLFACVSATVHPADAEQSVTSVSPIWFGGVVLVHPGSVCSAIWLFGMRLIASMMLGGALSVSKVYHVSATRTPYSLDFPVIWPGGAFGPECRPDGAPEGEVDEVDYPEAADVVGVLGGDADRGAFLVEGDVVGVVDLEDGVPCVVDIGQALGEGVVSVEPPYIAWCELIQRGGHLEGVMTHRGSDYPSSRKSPSCRRRIGQSIL